ncbi:MAG: Ig-like domain-containing protein [Acidobacteria bacterium]|nr:Ig-like domain-containing protein [Acidobacteriota bacterium]
MSPRPGFLPTLPLLVALASGSTAQEMDRYEAQYGTPVDVTITDLVQNGSAYEGRAVRTRGRLELAVGARRDHMLRDHFGNSVLVFPVRDIAPQFDQEALTMMGGEVQVTGVFRSGSLPAGDLGAASLATITFWQYVGPERETKGPIKAVDVTLESLVRNPGKKDGQTIRVVGKFRGSNLYGDLPSASRRSSSDWVIKDDVFAIWVTGKKPKGSGFSLDAGLKRDTGKWVEVIGRPETRGGVTYVRAVKVSLTSPPTPTAEAAPPPPPPERPKVAPVVVFSLPLDGEREIARDSRFVVQFSKDMDEQSFEGRVVLRYAGPRRPGDRLFDGLRLSYDWGRRALTVDPGDLLRPGRQVELLLLPGIADTDGLVLAPRQGAVAQGPSPQSADPPSRGDVAVEVLRYEVGL